MTIKDIKWSRMIYDLFIIIRVADLMPLFQDIEEPEKKPPPKQERKKKSLLFYKESN